MARRIVVAPGQASLPLVAPQEAPRPRPARCAHHCHLPGCDVEVPPKLLMCRKHWAMVPGAIRRDVWRYFDPAQCSDMPNRPRPSESWHRAANAAIEAVLDALGERVLAAIRIEPVTAAFMEDEPPGGMTPATFRRVLTKLFRAKRVAHGPEDKLIPA